MTEVNTPDLHTDESDDLFEHQRIVVDKKQSPLRIDKFLMDRLERVSRNKVQNAIKGGAIKVDDKEIKPNVFEWDETRFVSEQVIF